MKGLALAHFRLRSHIEMYLMIIHNLNVNVVHCMFTSNGKLRCIEVFIMYFIDKIVSFDELLFNAYFLPFNWKQRNKCFSMVNVL